MTIFVGNLDHTVREEELNQLFSRFGEIKQIKLMKDQYSGESKGFAFVDMMNERDASQAITVLDKKAFAGKTISVSKAKPRSSVSKFNRNW